ncbi:MAG: peptidylprolyl isomerase, partial [Methylococcales bacterium]
MAGVVKIDDEVITTDQFIKYLKLNGHYDKLVEDFVKDKLTVLTARKQGISVTSEDIQQRADQFRRVLGLHRAKQMNAFLDAKGISLEELEAHITDLIFKEQILERVLSDPAVKEYYNLNSPKFGTVDISHMILDSEGKAREMLSILMDAPEMFEEMAKEHSIADAKKGGRIGKITRGTLPPTIEAKVFNSKEGAILGPFPCGDGSFFEIIRINARKPARLDNETSEQIRKRLKDEWLAARVREHRV